MCSQGCIQGNRFKIAGGKPGMKVSWQVMGIRQDVYANRIPVEEDKPKEERGRYAYPQGYGKTPEQGVAARVRPVQPTPMSELPPSTSEPSRQ